MSLITQFLKIIIYLSFVTVLNWIWHGYICTFENINFAVFGLGNKTYENYNTMGKYFDKRLSQLGGSRLLDLGLGDDDGK